MNASILDFRKNMKSIQKALGRNESVTVLSHGTPIGVLMPFSKKKNEKRSVKAHPFFGMSKLESLSVLDTVNHLRKARYDF